MSPPDLSAAPAESHTGPSLALCSAFHSYSRCARGQHTAARWAGCWQMGEWALQRHTSSRHCFDTESLRPRSNAFCFLSYLLPLYIPLVTGLVAVVAGSRTRIFIQLSSLFCPVQPRLWSVEWSHAGHQLRCGVWITMGDHLSHGSISAHTLSVCRCVGVTPCLGAAMATFRLQMKLYLCRC